MPRDAACMTCRLRKVKCDRVYPTCSTCSRLGRLCVSSTSAPEITWTTVHVDGLSSLTSEIENHVHDKACSRQVGAKGKPLLSDPERARHVATLQASLRSASSIDQLLADLDRQQDCLKNNTICQGPFGIFRLHDACASKNQHALTRDEEEEEMMGSSPGLFLDSLAIGESIGETNIAAELQLMFAVAEQHPIQSTTLPTLTQSLNQQVEQEDFFLENDAMEQSLSIALPFAMPITYDAHVRDLDLATIRLLLNRYEHALTPCFSPAQIRSKSPWQELHIPKVHETLGSLMIKGEAENSKVSLLFAVLGASAYHLDIIGPSVQDDRAWKEIADSYRSRAKTRLKMSLWDLSGGRREETYADVLMALLSMVTICVVSGQMEEGHAYLRDVEHLIALYGVDKVKQPASVQMLHSTFLYLRTLQASVGIFGGKARARFVNGHLERPQDLGDSFMLSDQVATLWSNLLQTEQPVSESNEPPCHNCGKNLSTFVQIYSLPEALFHLISRVTSLVQKMEAQRRTQCRVTNLDQDPLSVEATQLETDICDWKNDIPDPEKETVLPYCFCCVSRMDASLESTNDGPSRVSLLYHFRKAMHSALLIYFYRCIRDVDTHILQQYVNETMDHLARYGERKRECNDRSSNVCWPGFIAGCEAVNPETRKRISAWFSSETSLTGIGMFEVAGQAVKQVWEARDRTKNRNLPWSKILMENSTLSRLVLS